MRIIQIEGGVPLRGSVAISGSKNAALPIMAASLLTNEPVELRNVPAIEDIDSMAEMLRHVGVAVEKLGEGRWRLQAQRVDSIALSAELTGRLRASFLMLGALVARTGEASMAKPGGDDIGMRRVEQHLEGLRAMGCDIREDGDQYVATAKSLHGGRIDLDMPTVTGTENLMMAAVLAKGITVIANAAREPHVVDLARCLAGMGAHISGAGSELIVIEGRDSLHGTSHWVTTDYIEAGTYMVMAAATHGDVTLERMRPADVRWLINKLQAAGAEVIEGASQVRVTAPGKLTAVDATTWPHPGFATDLQSQYVALMTQASGTSIVSEALFENRFRHVEELRKLGADVTVEGRSAIVRGPSKLRGERVLVPDIRSGAALVVAGLCADGVTELERIYHLDRGYERLVEKLAGLGARIARLNVGGGDTAVRDLSGVVGD
jgi:UDP-N-acetylglucosamine 1-carboxyvinyltransferase